MFKHLFTIRNSALALTVAAAAAAGLLHPGTASASTGGGVRLSDTRIALHFDLSKGQMPENVAEAPGGAFDVTFAKAAQVARISARGQVKILASLPKPADGGVHTPALGFELTSGIVRDQDGTLYFLYGTGTADLTGFWRLRPGGQPRRIAPLPATSFPNGLVLDQRTNTLYAADSALGTIWRVPVTGGTPTAWSAAPQLARTTLLGVNGLKIHDGALWATNLDQGTVLSIPIRPDGSAGAVRTVATGLDGIDDITFTGHGNQLLAAMVLPNEVEVVQDDGSHSVLLTAKDGLENPTSIALHGQTAYIFSAAYQTASDPNLIVSRIQY
jgi:hypothetical protein